MIIVSIIALLILIFSVVGGFKEGVVKHFSNLVAVIIAIPVTGAFYDSATFGLAILPTSE